MARGVIRNRKKKTGMKRVEEMGECCFAGSPKLLRHQSALQSFKEGQLRFFAAFYRPTHTHTHILAYTHTNPHLFP